MRTNDSGSMAGEIDGNSIATNPHGMPRRLKAFR